MFPDPSGCASASPEIRHNIYLRDAWTSPEFQDHQFRERGTSRSASRSMQGTSESSQFNVSQQWALSTLFISSFGVSYFHKHHQLAPTWMFRQPFHTLLQKSNPYIFSYSISNAMSNARCLTHSPSFLVSSGAHIFIRFSTAQPALELFTLI